MKICAKSVRNTIKDIWSRIYADIKQFLPGLVIFTIMFALTFILFHNNCIFTIVFGYPCPGCGLTRSLVLLLTLQFKEAFYMNPSIYLIIAVAIYIFICRYVMNRKMKHLMTILFTAGLISIAMYVVRMYYMYPDTPPMVYNDDNLINKLFDLWR